MVRTPGVGPRRESSRSSFRYLRNINLGRFWRTHVRASNLYNNDGNDDYDDDDDEDENDEEEQQRETEEEEEEEARNEHCAHAITA